MPNKYNFFWTKKEKKKQLQWQNYELTFGIYSQLAL